MPREVRKANREDLVGKLPGEDGEFLSDIARVLLNTAQMKVSGADSAEHHGGNGHSGATDTEVARPIERSPKPSDNGAELIAEEPGSDTLFDEPLFPEPETAMLAPEPAELDAEPAELSVQRAPEPEDLESVPDLTSPELDMLDDEEDATDILDATASKDTGVLEVQPPPPIQGERIDLAELAPDQDDDDTRRSKKIDPDDEDDRITSKVEQRPELAPRPPQPPGEIVRDTVNFYNQTQNLHGKSGADDSGRRSFPTISPNAVNSEDPLDLRSLDELPASLEPQGFELMAPEPLDDESLEPSLDADSLEPLSLDAEQDLDEADRRDTDRFNEEDRRPPRLPKPLGVDETAADETDGDLQAIADEKVAAGKDTQKFYVADILASKPKQQASSESTVDELQPAEVGPPPSALQPQASSGDTAADYTTDVPEKPRTKGLRKEITEVPLPEPEQVESDFLQQDDMSPAARIVPELSPGLDEQEEEDETDKAPQRPERITEKIARQPAPEPEPALSDVEQSFYPDDGFEPEPAVEHKPQPAPVAVSAPEPTDELSRKIIEERDATRHLLEAAERVSARLRAAGESARNELVRLSAAHPAVPETEPEPEPEHTDSGETVTDLPPQPQPEAAEDEVSLADTRKHRVPTQAIGDLLGRISKRLGDGPTSLEDMIEEASRRVEETPEEDYDDGSEPYGDPETMDLDALVAASSALREAIEAEREEELSSRRHEANPEAEDARTLTEDVEQIWEEVDAKRTSTIVDERPIPVRIRTRDDIGLAWTQEALWKTLVGLSAVSLALGVVFAWVIFKLFS